MIHRRINKCDTCETKCDTWPVCIDLERLFWVIDTANKKQCEYKFWCNTEECRKIIQEKYNKILKILNEAR